MPERQFSYLTGVNIPKQWVSLSEKVGQHKVKYTLNQTNKKLSLNNR